MSDENPAAYTEVDPAPASRFFGSSERGSVIMLNLLRFRDHADYSHAPDLEPEGGASGKEAYDLYMAGIEPLLVKSGGKLILSGPADAFLIGPQDEKWDYAMLVKQASKSAFLAFASDPVAQQITAHRTAAVADSRLLPVWADERFSDC